MAAQVPPLGRQAPLSRAIKPNVGHADGEPLFVPGSIPAYWGFVKFFDSSGEAGAVRAVGRLGALAGQLRNYSHHGRGAGLPWKPALW